LTNGSLFQIIGRAIFLLQFGVPFEDGKLGMTKIATTTQHTSQ